jgi:ribosomal protein S25
MEFALMPTTHEQHRGRAADTLSNRLLYTRRQAAELLGNVSLATLKRLEEEGILKPVRLNKRSTVSQVFYTHSNLMAVARGGGEDA